MARLPASLIRKYGVSKKAWAVYRSRSRTRTRSISHAMTKSMTKRRKSGKAGRFRRRGNSHGGGLNVRRDIVPIAVAAVAEPFIDNTIKAFVPAQFNTLPFGVQADDVAKVVAGIYLGRRGGMVGKTATYIGVFGLRNIVSQAVGGVLMPTAAGTAASTGATF